jgi:hypothetical protein
VTPGGKSPELDPNPNYYYNTDTRSRNHCCRGKAISITYSECVSVALVMRHQMRMRHIVLSSVACFAVPYSSTLYYKRHDTKFYKNPPSASRIVPFRQTDKHPCPQRYSNPGSQQSTSLSSNALDRKDTGIGIAECSCVFSWNYSQLSTATTLHLPLQNSLGLQVVWRMSD